MRTMPRSFPAFLARVSLACAMVFASVLPAQQPVQGDWNTQANGYRGRNGERITFSFPGGGTLSSRVWGTDLYTDDSSIASAAVHAGLITTTGGGLVTIEIRPGAASYRGTARNGVTSRDYGAYDGSFTFVSAAPTQGGAIQGSWSMQADGYRGRNGTRVTIAFPAGGSLSPRVWGTDLYTDDSAIASAAVHAGLITTAAGGVVTIEIRPGASSYRGTARNGVTSRDYGGYSGSFVFVTDGVSVPPPIPVRPTPPTAAPTPAPTPTPSTPPAGAIQGNWTMQADGYRGRNGTRVTIAFPAGGSLSPRVWGTDLYTDDSAIASAAVHAGLITTAAGGVVTIEIRPGASSYRGTARNGVTSREYGAYSGSFVFVTGGAPVTPPTASPPSPSRPLTLTGGWVHSADRNTVTPTSHVILVQEGDQVTKYTSYKPYPDRPEWATLICKGPLVGQRLTLMCSWAPGGDPFGFGPPRGYGVPWPETYTVSADFNHLNGVGPQAQYYSRRP